jgi:hypothetical protein
MNSVNPSCGWFEPSSPPPSDDDFTKETPAQAPGWYYKTQKRTTDEWWLDTDSRGRIIDSQGFCCNCDKEKKYYGEDQPERRYASSLVAFLGLTATQRQPVFDSVHALQQRPTAKSRAMQAL